MNYETEILRFEKKLSPWKEKGLIRILDMASDFPSFYKAFQEKGIIKKKEYDAVSVHMQSYRQWRNETSGLNAFELTLPSQISLEWYRKNLFSSFIEDKESIAMLARWIRSHKDNGSVLPAPLQTRSYEIFHDEKFLLNKKYILTRLKLSDENLCLCCNIVHPAIFAVPSSNSEKNILILENKEIWKSLLPVPKGYWDFVFFGGGTAIEESFHSIPDQTGAEWSQLKCFYAGDIDRSGIAILYRLYQKMPIQVHPFLPFYKSMLQYKDMASHKQQSQRVQEAETWFLNFFNESEQIIIQNILEQNLCIPQEAVPLEVLNICMKKGNL